MTARRLNTLLVAILVPLAVLAFVSAGAAVWMWRHPAAVMIVRQAVDTYPPSLRWAIRDEFRQFHGEAVEDIARLDEARRRLFGLLRAKTLDEAAIRAAMADVRVAVSNLQLAGQEHMLAVIRNAPPEERAKIRIPEEGFAGRFERFGG
jgi:uncharacterized membrane protein